MIIFEIVTPGTRIAHENRDWAWKIEGQLEGLKLQFVQANIALNLFNSAQSIPISRPDIEDIVQSMQRQAEIRVDVEQEYANSTSCEKRDDIHYEANVRFKREKWLSGEIPREFEQEQSLVYAKAFLYALDGFDKFLDVLAKEENIPESVKNLHAEVTQLFPHLRGVRNTAQHLEDRSRGLGARQRGRPPQPLDLKPINHEHINAPRGALILSSLIGSKFGSTMADGHFGEIDVSVESMVKLQTLLEGTLNSFEWRGPKQHFPNVKIG